MQAFDPNRQFPNAMTADELIYLRVELKRRRIRQTSIAADLGVTSAYISQVLLGVDYCSPALRDKLLAYVADEREPAHPTEPFLNLILKCLYEQDITQGDFAAAMGVTSKHMSQVMMGTTGPGWELLIAMLDYVGYEIAVAKK